MKKILWLLIGILVFVFLVPLGINYAFKVPAFFKVFEAEWEAGDLLGYYGSVLGGIVSFLVLYLTLKKEREQVIEAEKRSKRTYLDVAFDLESRADLKDRQSLPRGTRIYILEKNTGAIDESEEALFLEISNNSSETVYNLTVHIAYQKNAIKESVVNIAQMRSNETILMLLPIGTSIRSLIQFAASGEKERIWLDKVIVCYRTAAYEMMKAELICEEQEIRYYIISKGKDEILFAGKMFDDWYRYEG